MAPSARSIFSSPSSSGNAPPAVSPAAAPKPPPSPATPASATTGVPRIDAAALVKAALAAGGPATDAVYLVVGRAPHAPSAAAAVAQAVRGLAVTVNVADLCSAGGDAATDGGSAGAPPAAVDATARGAGHRSG